MIGRATTFEFRHRFWVIAAVFTAGFFVYAVDPRNVSVALARALAGGGGTAPWALVRAVLLGCALLVAASAALRTWAAAYLRSEVVHDGALHAERLVADGPYRHVRNPLYLGTLLLAVGLAGTASVTGAAVIVVGMTGVVLRLIAREEGELLERHGPSFQRYLDAVPRVIPSLRPRVDPSGEDARWSQALAGELFSWGFAAGSVVFAFTLDLREAGLIWLLGLAVYLVQRLRERRDRAAQA